MKICKKCGKDFKARIKINGKWCGSARRNYCWDCSPYNTGNRRQLINYTGDTKKCTKCSKFLPNTEQYYSARKDRADLYSVCRSCKSDIGTEKSRVFKKKCLEYIGSKCIICQYDKYVGALQFHHVAPDEKDFKISGPTVFTKEIKKELDKCIVVCSRCHDEIHGGLHPKYLDKL